MLNLTSIIQNQLINYPSRLNLNYKWSFGSLAGFCLIIQLLTGIFLAMHYNPSVNEAFNSVEHIMRDISYGWFLRYMHANGASAFFTIVYIHMGRAFYFQSYRSPRGHLWASGVTLFLLMMATAFIGYVLPWGQMSFWGATVITNLFSAIPYIGTDIAQWIWGGFSVDNPTLNRFFSLHYLVPFIIAAISLMHLIFLHESGSSSPTIQMKQKFIIKFFPYLIIKDGVSFLFFFLVFLFFIFFSPNTLGHTDNYIPANPLVTPTHIVPEWYFLPFYAMLRSIPDKLGGVLCMIGAIVLLYFLPLIDNRPYRNVLYSLISKIFLILFFLNFLFLGWLGQKPVEYPFTVLGLYATIFYFSYILFIIPLLKFFEIIYLSLYKK